MGACKSSFCCNDKEHQSFVEINETNNIINASSLPPKYFLEDCGGGNKFDIITTSMAASLFTSEVYEKIINGTKMENVVLPIVKSLENEKLLSLIEFVFETVNIEMILDRLLK
jgi:hypothetical protein